MNADQLNHPQKTASVARKGLSASTRLFLVFFYPSQSLILLQARVPLNASIEVSDLERKPFLILFLYFSYLSYVGMIMYRYTFSKKCAVF